MAGMHELDAIRNKIKGQFEGLSLVLCSNVKRTRQTLEGIRPFLPASIKELTKFTFLDKIKWTEELVAQKIKHVCDDMNSEHLAGVFLDFSVSKYRHIGWSLNEAIGFILDRLDEYSDIPIVPILSIKYESPAEAQFKIAQVIEDSNIANRVGGIDFVGDESKFNADIQRPICQMWQGKLVRMHVGESQSENNVVQAIEDFGVTNIAHGINAHGHAGRLAPALEQVAPLAVGIGQRLAVVAPGDAGADLGHLHQAVPKAIGIDAQVGGGRGHSGLLSVPGGLTPPWRSN
jgi:hypothetical protein